MTIATKVGRVVVHNEELPFDKITKLFEHVVLQSHMAN